MWSPEDDDNPGILEYQGRKYAVGLLWLVTGEDEKKTLRRRRIQKANADFYCQRTHISRQMGFGWLAKGHRRHMPVAAIVVADQLVGEWHGVFQADNGWWYMQVHSDAIAPNGDQFFLAESDAYAVFHENLTKHNWSHSYAPVHWNVAEASREMTLARLLDDVPSITLQSTGFDSAIGGAQNRNILIAMAFGLMMLIAIIYAFSSLWTQPEEIVTPKATPIPTLEPPKKDVVEIPSPAQVIDQCRRETEKLFKPVLGWHFKQLGCSADMLTVTWEYDDKNVSIAQANIRNVPNATSVSLQGKSMTAKKAMVRPVPLTQENLMSLEAATLKLQETFTQMGALAIKPVTPPVPPPPPQSVLMGSDPPIRPLPPRSYLDVKLETQESPERMKSYLDLNGLQLVSIVWDIPKGVWQYKMMVMLSRPSEQKAAE